MASLDQWEARLRPYFSRGLRLIAEIPLNKLDVEDIAAGVRASLERQGVAAGTRFLWDRYPLTLLALMAGFAAHNVEQNYWEAFGQFIGVSPHNYLFNQGWHSNFRDEAGERGLRTFDWDEAGFRYVATIRFHGGIPAYSLPDFFERILLPTIERPGLRAVEPGKALDTVLKTAYFVDSPVINFLQNSGKLGVEFFASCQKLARHYFKTRGEVLPAQDLDLPEYVVEAFAEFMEAKGEKAFHFRKPLVLMASEAKDGYLWLKLPEQEIPLQYAGTNLEWRIRFDNELEPLCKQPMLIRRRQDTLLTEILVPLEKIHRTLNIELVSEKSEGTALEVLRNWRIRILPEGSAAPLMAFLSDGRMVAAHTEIPAEVLTLIFPVDAELTVDGPHQIIEDYGRMAYPWDAWQMQIVDLSTAWSVQVERDGGLVGSVVSVKGKYPVPELIGGHIPNFAESALYIGELPSLKIPLRSIANPHHDLAKWRISLHSKWAAWPEVNIETNLNAYTADIAYDDDCATLPLKVFLGATPVGTYSLHVTGPGDAAAEFSFRTWPKLTVIGLPKFVMGEAGENENVKFNLLLPDEATCEPQAGSGDVKVSPSSIVWEVSAGPDVVRAPLNLNFKAPTGTIVRVPLTIPIPRMRRAVTLDNDLSKLEWSTRIVQKSSDAYLQSETSALHIEMFGLRNMVDRAEIQLVSFIDENQILQAENLKPTPFSKDWLRVSLNSFKDTINHASQQGRFDFVLPATYDKPEIRIPLAIFSRRFTVNNLQLTQIDTLRYRMTWEEPSQLRNRRVMLVSTWQPWQIPLEYRIPDDAHGEFILENVSLPELRYHMYFYIAPTWYPEQTKPPADTKPLIIDLVSPEKRLEQLVELEETTDDKFKVLCEMACIQDSMGDYDGRDITISKMALPFAKISNLQLLLSSVNWLIDRVEKSPYAKFFTNTAFNYDRVTTILNTYPQDHPLLRRYFGFITKAKMVDRDSLFLIAERSEDPVVINACLYQLLNKKEPILILLVEDMIEKARLSNQDAIDILSEEPAWALEVLASQNSSPIYDQIIAGLLSEMSMEEKSDNLPLTLLAMRALPYIKDEFLADHWLSRIFTADVEKSIILIFRLMEQGVLPEHLGEKYITQAPESANNYLSSIEPSDFTNKWLAFLADQFPQLAGVIRPNIRLSTPLGEVIIDYLLGMDGTRVPEALIRERNCKLNILIGEGGERTRAWLDLSEGTITFIDCDKLVGCGHCGYMHPEQLVVSKHIKKHHNGMMKLRLLTPQQDIDLDEIKIIP